MTGTQDRWTIAIDRDDIRAATIGWLPLAELDDGQIEVAIDRFALTANNITYALFGKPAGLFGNDQGYWDFFSSPGGPGHLPVWGFARVTASTTDAARVGDLLYGYFPMASHAVLTPGRAGDHGFTDVTPHRTSLPAIYNQYQQVDALPDYRDADHDLWPIFRPLFLTGWLIADQLEEDGDHGAAQILVGSASSKTAIGLGFSLGRRDGARPRSIGLTSAANVAALAAQGIYDDVAAYDAIGAMDASVPSVFVDMAGNGAVTAAVHGHFGDQLRASIVVGKSHWDVPADTGPLAGPPRMGFFAPGRSAKRAGDWGAAGFQARIADAWLAFMDRAPALCRVDVRPGGAAALAAYDALLDGRADPAAGIVITP